jgi:hypothetical protein
MNSETRKPGKEVEVWFFKIPGFLASEFFLRSSAVPGYARSRDHAVALELKGQQLVVALNGGPGFLLTNVVSPRFLLCSSASSALS